MLKIWIQKKGFTPIEIVIAMFVFATLTGIVTINLLHAQSKTALDSETGALLSEIKNQQTLAMSGNIQTGSSPTEYGIRFSGNTYTLFAGSNYTADNISNFTVTMKNGVTFSSITFPSSVIIFQRATGEIVNYDPALNQITLTNEGGETKTITLNRLGVFTSVQ